MTESDRWNCSYARALHERNCNVSCRVFLSFSPSLRRNNSSNIQIQRREFIFCVILVSFKTKIFFWKICPDDREVGDTSTPGSRLVRATLIPLGSWVIHSRTPGCRSAEVHRLYSKAMPQKRNNKDASSATELVAKNCYLRNLRRKCHTRTAARPISGALQILHRISRAFCASWTLGDT